MTASASDKYTQIITQIEYNEDGSIRLDKFVNVEKNGSASSVDDVLTGSTFILDCINNENNVSTEIQTLHVDAYDPEAKIKLLGLEDLYVGPDGSRRARADRPPYTVQYTIDGLVTNDPTAQPAARMVNLDTDVAILAPETTVVPDGAPLTNLHVFIDDNKTDSLDLIGLDHVPSSRTGLITYTTSSLADGEILGSILGSKAKVYIYPKPSGSIDLPADIKHLTSIPDIPVTVTNAYPRAVNYLRITRLSSGEQFDLLNTGSWPNGQAFTQNRSWTIRATELSDHVAFKDAHLDETFSISFRTKTDFDDFEFDSRSPLSPEETIRIRGLITSAE